MTAVLAGAPNVRADLSAPKPSADDASSFFIPRPRDLPLWTASASGSANPLVRDAVEYPEPDSILCHSTLTYAPGSTSPCDGDVAFETAVAGEGEPTWLTPNIGALSVATPTAASLQSWSGTSTSGLETQGGSMLSLAVGVGDGPWAPGARFPPSLEYEADSASRVDGFRVVPLHSPAPSAAILGVIGLSMIGWVKRRFA